jgi:hypothetical protein
VATQLTYVRVGHTEAGHFRRKIRAHELISSVGWGDGRNPNKLRCHCVGVRKLTPTYQCSIKGHSGSGLTTTVLAIATISDTGKSASAACFRIAASLLAW